MALVMSCYNLDCRCCVLWSKKAPNQYMAVSFWVVDNLCDLALRIWSKRSHLSDDDLADCTCLPDGELARGETFSSLVMFTHDWSDRTTNEFSSSREFNFYILLF